MSLESSRHPLIAYAPNTALGLVLDCQHVFLVYGLAVCGSPNLGEPGDGKKGGRAMGGGAIVCGRWSGYEAEQPNVMTA
jgi:hypothetical protein